MDNPKSVELASIAQSKGGKLIGVYTNPFSNIEMECVNGHRFKDKYKNFKDGVWCDQCPNISLRSILEEMDIVANYNVLQLLFRCHGRISNSQVK